MNAQKLCGLVKGCAWSFLIIYGLVFALIMLGYYRDTLVVPLHKILIVYFGFGMVVILLAMYFALPFWRNVLSTHKSQCEEDQR